MSASTKKILGRYRVLEPLGGGGMADVFLAETRGPAGFHKLVVVKQMRSAIAEDPHFREMFLHEARLAARLSHPNIVQTHEVGEQEGAYFLAMEYLEGQSLARLAKASALPKTLAVRVVCDALRGLAHAHELADYCGRPLEIVHRDISPQNIFVTYDGQTKLLDFGVAKASWAAVQETEVGVLKGKLAYMAPEQARGERVDARADIFAMGVVLWELLAGRRLFGCKSNAETMHRLLAGDVPTLGDVEPSLEAIVLRALSRDREGRFETAEAMRGALEAVLSRHAPDEGRAEAAHLMSALFAAERDEKRKRLARLVAELSYDEISAAPQVGVSLSPSSLPAVSAPSRASRGRPLAALAGIALAIAAVGAVLALTLGRTGATKPASAATLGTPALAEVPPPCPSGMVLVPGGSFYMGADDGQPNEKPSHQVWLSPFCIDETEVTTAAYKSCSDRGECKRASTSNDWPGISDHDRAAFDPLCNARAPGQAERGTHPINCVDWERADKFCSANGKRLPTEAEWELAARGPDGRRYPWGDEEPSASLLNACGAECVAWGEKNGVDLAAMHEANDGWAATAPVGSFPKGASRYGLKDVVGNVWEWVADYASDYTSAVAKDPTGPRDGDARVLRGGAWNGAFASWVRPTFRFKGTPAMRSHGVGFRCAGAPR